MSNNGVPPSFHFFAGLTTGCISAILLQPADLLKTRVQQARSISLVTTFRDILAGPNSLKELWRGTLPSVIRTGVGSALYFSSLNALRQHIARSNLLASTGLVKAKKGNPEYSSSSLPRLSNMANLTTGAIARASAGFIMMPITVIKVRYESSLYSYQTMWGAGTAILKGEGMKGFFAGFGVTAVRDAPYAGLYVLFYEHSKRRMSQLWEATPLTDKPKYQDGMKSSTSVSINFISGVSAAVFATAVTNPFDAVKTRLQLMPGKYGNMIRAGRRMVREDGVRSLFDGLGLRIGRKALSSALAWTLYEELVRQAELKFQERSPAVGCCHSIARDGEQSSPYSPAIHGDSSSRAIASASAQLPENPSPRTSSQLPDVTERSRTRRHLPLGEQFNAPIRPHVWTSNRQWTRSQLDRERREFFDTRVTGHAEIWASLKVVVGLLADGDISTAQSILDAAAITVPTGDLKNGSYDEAGNHYSMPEHIISDPQNLVPDHESIAKGEMSNEVTDDDEELERKRAEKGKAVLKTGDFVKIKARLSDRGGPDIIITIGKDQAVRILVRRIRKEANLQGKVKIAYMGKILRDAETLQAQGWREGHVVNALVFDLS